MQLHHSLAYFFDSLADEEQEFLDVSLPEHECLTAGSEEYHVAELDRVRTANRIAKLRSLSAYHQGEFQALRDELLNA